MSEIFKTLPDFLRPCDLVSLGLFSSRDALYSARAGGKSPDFIRVGRRIIYPKAGILDFIERHLHKGTFKSSDFKESRQKTD